jgi:SAM-dependent methyltransferase
MSSTDELARLFRAHHARLFESHGATPRGVDWNDEREFLFRYGKMLDVISGDPERRDGPTPTLLDVGCGWGGFAAYAQAQGVPLEYVGIDIVPEMVEYGRKALRGARFIVGDFLEWDAAETFDYLVCNGTLTQKLDATLPAMEAYAKAMVRKMFARCRRGIAVNFMSNRVNFMVPNLFYRSPVEVLAWCLDELSPRVRLDHGYSSLAGGQGKLFDFTVYVYRG